MESWPWETIKHKQMQRTTDDSSAKVTRVVRVHSNYFRFLVLHLLYDDFGGFY